MPISPAIPLLLFGGSASPLTTEFYLNSGTYYVDSVNGNDANDGASPTTPFENLSALPTLTGGEVISLAYGSTWREQLTLATGCKVGAYVPPQTGATAQPKILAHNFFGTWAKTSGRTNVYERTITTGTDGTNDWINVLEVDGATVTMYDGVADLATCDSTPGSYYVPNPNVSPATVYVHTLDSDDPDVNAASFALTIREHTIDARNINNITLFDLSCEGNMSHSGSVVCGRSATIDSCTIRYGNKHNLYVGDGSTVQNCTIEYSEFAGGNATLVVANENTPASLGVSWIGNILRGYGANVADTNGIHGHYNTSGDYGRVYIYNNTFEGLNAAIIRVDAGSEGCIVDSNTCTDCNIFYTHTQTTYDQVLSNNTVTSTVPVSVAVTVNSAVTYTLINETYCIDSPVNGAVSVLVSNATLDIDNCTIEITNAATINGCVFVNNSLTGVTVSVDGTSMTMNTGSNLRFLPTGGGVSYSGDNNCYDRAGGIRVNFDGSNYTSLATWQSAGGGDASSSVGGC